MKKLSFVLILLASVAFAACSNSNNNGTTPNQPTCTLPAGISNPFLVYPESGSSTPGGAVMQIVIATQGGSLVSNGSSSWDVLITDSLNPSGLQGGTFLNTVPPFPSPNQLPPYANPFYQASSFSGGFASGQAVTVYVNNAASLCNPIKVGSFTAT